jgi:hypothetical protein
LTGEAANQGSEHGIIIVSGHDAGSFWNQAAGAAQGGSTAAVIATTAVSHAEIAGLTQAASAATGSATAHDFSSALDISAHSATLNQGVVAHDTGLFHAELGTIALHDALSSGAFAHQLHV